MSKKLAPIHPGEILRTEFLEPLGLSQNQLALELHVPPTRIHEIIHAKRSITAETAMRLGRYFGTSPELWLGLQQRYDLELAEDEAAAKVKREVRPRELAQR
jgi:antitoxin HigA-1